ncbi:hypothetical protein ACGFYU_28810 [Streptomyces sp. NPDC048337]|uniref:hypothetical protein n=1 Tax=Streptomyces sp. NPDC048337 TaxID=3365535 RepID=UPI00371AACAC
MRSFSGISGVGLAEMLRYDSERLEFGEQRGEVGVIVESEDLQEPGPGERQGDADGGRDVEEAGQRAEVGVKCDVGVDAVDR